MDSLKPLFHILENGEVTPVLPEVKSGETIYRTEEFIVTLASAVEEDARDLYKGKRGGELTLGVYLLLEILHRIDLPDVAQAMMSSPTALEQGGLFFQLGVHAGRRIPEEVLIGTRKVSSGAGLRPGGSGEDQGPN